MNNQQKIESLLRCQTKLDKCIAILAEIKALLKEIDQKGNVVPFVNKQKGSNNREEGMGRYYILDKEGNPQLEPDLMKWVQDFESANRIVAKDRIKDAEVSTVFLGINYNYGDGKPLLWETMVFGGKLNDEQQRYSSLEDAKKGHELMVRRVQGNN